MENKTVSLISIPLILEIDNIKKLDESILYDVIIIGGGPAGLTAGVYCMRKGLNVALITENIGGQLIETSGIENYMGYRYIEGCELVNKFKEQVIKFGISFTEGKNVIKIDKQNKIKTVYCDEGKLYKAKSLIIASGSSPRKLNIPGEKKLIGKGVAYCATCDAPFYKNKIVAVAGGGNSGVEAAIDLLRIAGKVILIQNREFLTADKILVDRIKENKNIEIFLNNEVKELIGERSLSEIKIININDKKEQSLKADGIFIEIGYKPNSDFSHNILEINKNNEIIVDCLCRTSVPGIFGAGDVTSVAHKQIIIACGEGAKAALSCYNYLLHN